LRAFETEISDIESGVKPKQFIIGVSANGTKDVREDAIHSGMSDFCSKPFSLQNLIDVQIRRKENDMLATHTNSQQDLCPFMQNL
jgi:CheY-like chemotaxis protein